MTNFEVLARIDAARKLVAYELREDEFDTTDGGWTPAEKAEVIQGLIADIELMNAVRETDAILKLLRNRHRGPITAEELPRMAQAFYEATSMSPDITYNSMFAKPAIIEGLAAALEAARGAEAGRTEQTDGGRRAPVQKGPHGPAGTIAWSEHLRVWDAYARRHSNAQSAERIAERGGFGHGEILDLTGGLPQTFTRTAPTDQEATR